MRSTQRNLVLYKSICSCSRPVRNGKPTGAPVLQKAYGPVTVDTGESRECLAEPLASHSFHGVMPQALDPADHSHTLPQIIGHCRRFFKVTLTTFTGAESSAVTRLSALSVRRLNARGLGPDSYLLCL
jgi:hypothetical protein